MMYILRRHCTDDHRCLGGINVHRWNFGGFLLYSRKPVTILQVRLPALGSTPSPCLTFFFEPIFYFLFDEILGKILKVHCIVFLLLLKSYDYTFTRTRNTQGKTSAKGDFVDCCSRLVQYYCNK